MFLLFSVLLTDIVVFEFTKPGSQNKHLGRVFAWIFAVLFPVFNLSHCFNFILKNYEAWSMCQPLQDDCRSGIPNICCNNQPGKTFSFDKFLISCYCGQCQYILIRKYYEYIVAYWIFVAHICIIQIWRTHLRPSGERHQSNCANIIS